MSQFEFLSVALSFVLGLAVTVLLTSLLKVFLARHRTHISWLVLAWAFYLLVMQFDVWWEVYGLVAMDSWTAGAFVLLLLIALLLFAAGGLILPTSLSDYPNDLDDYFRQHGRWAIAVVGLFQVFAIVANTVLFDIPILGAMNRWNALAVTITVVAVSTERRAIQAGATIAYGAWLAAYIWMFVPASF